MVVVLLQAPRQVRGGGVANIQMDTRVFDALICTLTHSIHLSAIQVEDVDLFGQVIGFFIFYFFVFVRGAVVVDCVVVRSFVLINE